jgi:hypothetical protein
VITKKVPMRSIGKSDYGALVEYLTDRQDKYERLGYVSVTNCQSEEWQVAITEVLNTQAKNTRAITDKTYHLIVSFRTDEQPDEATLKAIETHICDGLGFGEHQRVCVVHHDTDNLHFHIAINKIHPTRYTIHDPYNDHWALGILCKKLEQKYNLEADNHQAAKTGSENRAADMERQAGVQSLLGWIKRECADQLKNAQSWAELHYVMGRYGLTLRERGNGLVITNGAGLGVKASSVARELSKSRLEQRLGAYETADEVTAILQAVQMRLAQSIRKGRNQSDSDAPVADRLDAAVQAAQAHLTLLAAAGKDPFADRLAAVVQAAQGRLAQSPTVGKVGSLPPPRRRNVFHNLSQLEVVKIQPSRQYEAQPMRSRVDTSKLYGRYKTEQQNSSTRLKTEKAKTTKRKDRLIESAKKKARLKRSAIKTIKGARTSKKILYGVVSRTLKDEIQKINKQYLAERLAINDKYQRRAWADWLRAKATEGDQEALSALRAREAARGLGGDTVTGGAGRKVWQGLARQDCVTKQGTVIYRVGSTAVRDDGKKLKISRGFDREGLQDALRLAMERYGNCIAVNGTEIFRENIVQAAAEAKLPLTFADAALELQRRELLARENANGYSRQRAGQPGSSQTIDSRGGTGRERPDSRGIGRPGFSTTGIQTWRAGGDHSARGAFPGKPDLGGIGRRPPPQSQNRLRELSELGVVQLANRGELLLPRDVPDHLEQQGAKPDHGVRRDVFRPGIVAAGQAAADEYIAEREAMRLKVSDVPKHRRYDLTAGGGPAAFAGLRQVEGEMLVLLKRGEEVLVLPADAGTARRLRRVTIGTAVTVTAKGSVVKAKGLKI